MRQGHCTITPSVVRATARAALQSALPWRPYGRLVTVPKLLDVLLLAAALASSLSAVVKRFRLGFSHETARKALDANLTGYERLTPGLVDSLHRFLPRRLVRRRRWVVAIDEHRSPFYGDRSTPGVTGGPRKQGSKYAYAYATAALVHRRHRYTVGLIPLAGGEKPHQVVAALLGQLDRHGVRARGVVLDAGFDSGETVLLLQARNLSYAVPLRRKGSGKNRRNAAWEKEVGSVTTVDWVTEESRQPVSTDAVVVQRPKEKDKKVYAFGGWGAAGAGSAALRARQARRWYRSRFGIETSYRQLNECKARTTRKEVGYRLLLVGLALLLRQAWVWLSARVAADRGLRPSAWVGELPLARMVEWLAELLKHKYKEEKEIQLGSPLPPLEVA
jgi:hypothetical protein